MDLVSDGHDEASSEHGWHKVSYAKRNRNRKHKPSANVEQHADDPRRRILDSHTVRSKRWSDYSDHDDSDSSVDQPQPQPQARKVKQKKPKVTLADAAAKVDAADLAAFLIHVSGSFQGQHDIQLMRFADYFGRAFSSVTGAQFPWMKMFKESPVSVSKIADIPLTHISDALYKTSADWINQHPLETLSSFVLWCLDSILADLASQQAGSKGPKKGGTQLPSKSQVAIFVVLAIVLRRKPDVLVSLSPTLKETSKYQGQDKLPVFVWMICQAQQGDLCVGLHSWAHNLLPIVVSKSCNPQSRDLVLQLVERILSVPKARTILVNGAVRKGERLIPPSSLEILLRVTFPAFSARVKATERFEAIYPTLKDVALAGVPGSKAMKHVSQQILSFAANVAGENNPNLSNEATAIFIWCLTQHGDCYKQWEKIYDDNLEVSVCVLKRLSREWKEHSSRLSPYEALRDALKSFRRKNERMLANEEDTGHQVLLKDADKYSKAILSRISHGHGCMISMSLIVIALGVSAAFMAPDMKSGDWENLPAVFTEKLAELSMVFNEKLAELSMAFNEKLSELSIVLSELKRN